MKSIMLSVQPKWVEKIASGKKTIVVRKSRPKLETPFKCYIYCTSKKQTDNEWQYKPNLYLDKVENKVRWIDVEFTRTYNCEYLQQRVIGEFVCDRIDTYYYGGLIIPTPLYDGDDSCIDCGEGYYIWPRELNQICLTYDQLNNCGKGKTLYGWHIGNLVIYDEPKELSEFYQECKEYGKTGTINTPKKCQKCRYQYTWGLASKCRVDGLRPLTRPFQSWGYIEGFENYSIDRKGNNQDE